MTLRRIAAVMLIVILLMLIFYFLLVKRREQLRVEQIKKVEEAPSEVQLSKKREMLHVGQIKKVKEIPLDVQLFDSNSVKNVPESYYRGQFSRCMEWPNKKHIEEHRADKRNIFCDQNSTIQWIQKFLKPEWVPSDLDKRLIPARIIPIKGITRGCDGFIGRYAMGEYMIQICVRYDFGSFIVKRKNSVPVRTTKEMKNLALEVFKVFFNDSTEISNGQIADVKRERWKFKNFSGILFASQTHPVRWIDGWATFWTDGKTFKFTFKRS